MKNPFFQAQLLDPEGVQDITVPDVEGLLRDLLVHEEDISRHLARIGEDLGQAQSALNSIDSEVDRETVQAEFLEHLGGFTSLATLVEAVEDAYSKAIICVETINQNGSILAGVTREISQGDDSPELVSFVVGESAVVGLAALAVLAGGVAAGSVIPGLVAGSAAAAVISPGVREGWKAAGNAALDGTAAAIEGVIDLKLMVGKANQAIDDLGVFAKRLDEACSGLHSKTKSLVAA